MYSNCQSNYKGNFNQVGYLKGIKIYMLVINVIHYLFEKNCFFHLILPSQMTMQVLIVFCPYHHPFPFVCFYKKQIMVCHCKPPSDGSLGCRDQCLNRMLNIECVKGTCPCGELCSNQQVCIYYFLVEHMDFAS